MYSLRREQFTSPLEPKPLPNPDPDFLEQDEKWNSWLGTETENSSQETLLLLTTCWVIRRNSMNLKTRSLSFSSLFFFVWGPYPTIFKGYFHFSFRGPWNAGEGTQAPKPAKTCTKLVEPSFWPLKTRSSSWTLVLNRVFKYFYANY